MIHVRALGGSGEYLRNCFLLEADGHCFLLDCGVKRILGRVDEVYPLVSRQIASRLEAVFLSHAHEDHTAALPYLLHLGYRGPVYGSPETISLAPGFMRKWAMYVVQHGGSLPFDPSLIDIVPFHSLSFSSHLVSGVPLTVGRSGHMWGSYWYQFHFPSGTVLYTGDTASEGLLLAADPFPSSDVLIVDSAYASSHFSQKRQYQTVIELCEKTVAAGGSVLFPVPANGRGSDILIALGQAGFSLVVERTVFERCRDLLQARTWLRGSFTVPRCVVSDEATRDSVPLKGRLILTPDGMLTSPIGLSYLARIRHDPISLVILTGYVAKGTMGYTLRETQEVRTSQVTIKVHPDSDDVARIVSSVHPKKVMLYHAPLAESEALALSLRQKRVEVTYGVNQTLSFP